jgi:hypothetical protein
MSKTEFEKLLELAEQGIEATEEQIKDMTDQQRVDYFYALKNRQKKKLPPPPSQTPEPF